MKRGGRGGACGWQGWQGRIGMSKDVSMMRVWGLFLH